MEYIRQENMGDHEIYESYEGSPQEIIELLRETEKEDGCINYVQEDAVDFIFSRIENGLTREDIRRVLDLEEDYMRSIGIVID